jgi:crossover junction endodeoxyribonuclease RuvC
MIILGVDPGSVRTGFGIIQTDGRRHVLRDKGVLAPAKHLSLPEKLAFIHHGVAAIIASTCPDILAVEDIFHAANTRSALILGHVRGAVLLAGAQAGVPVFAFPPATVKLQVTGYGRAEKAQVALMVARLLELPGDGEPGDASDALAVALCHAHLHPAGLPRSPAVGPSARRPS